MVEAAMLLKLFGWFATTVVGGWIGAYFGSYARRKGENLATHEDIDKLVDQVRAVTREQEAIKASISGELWNRQAAFTMKRDTYVAIISALADYESVAFTGEGVFDYDSGTQEMRPKPGKQEEGARFKARLATAWEALNRSLTLGDFVFDAQTVEALKRNALPDDGIKMLEIPVAFGNLRSVLRTEAQRELFGLQDRPESK